MSSEAKKYFIPVNGELVEVSEELYREYYRPYGTPAIMPGRTASVVAPKLSCGNAMAYAQVARSTQPVKKCLSTPLSEVKIMTSRLATL